MWPWLSLCSEVISDPLGFDAIIVSSLHGVFPTVPSQGTGTNSLCQEDVTGSGVMSLKVVAWWLSVAFSGRSYRWAAFPSTHDLGQFLPRWHTFTYSCPTDISMSQAAIQGDPFLLACCKATDRSLKLSSWARESLYSTLGQCVAICVCAITLGLAGFSVFGDVLGSFRAFYTLCDGDRAQTSRTGPEGAPRLPDP